MNDISRPSFRYGVRSRITGQGPGPSGRKTLAASFTPSRMGAKTSWCGAMGAGGASGFGWEAGGRAAGWPIAAPATRMAAAIATAPNERGSAAKYYRTERRGKGR